MEGPDAFMSRVSWDATPTELELEESGSGFESFFRAEHRRLVKALYLVTGNAHEADELAQEAFLRLWERWNKVRSMDDPTGYLYRTAMNAFRSRVRRAMAAARRAAPFRETGDDFARVDAHDALTRALGTLTRRQRAAVVLTEYLGYGSDEAGAILGVKAVTVRVLASQGRTALRDALGATDE
jgi:RNA polymerase sigma-70 factor, ECF subfamily